MGLPKFLSYGAPRAELRYKLPLILGIKILWTTTEKFSLDISFWTKYKENLVLLSLWILEDKLSW